jgi:hypothetical protein
LKLKLIKNNKRNETDIEKNWCNFSYYYILIIFIKFYNFLIFHNSFEEKVIYWGNNEDRQCDILKELIVSTDIYDNILKQENCGFENMKINNYFD